MTTRELFLSKNYTVIASPIDFTLKFNSRGWDAGTAEDVIHYKSGWYIFDNNALLAPRWGGVRNTPKYNAFIEFDETKLENGAEVVTYTCYVNPKSIDSLNTDVTEISAPQMGEVLSAIESGTAAIDSGMTSVVSTIRRGVVDFGDFFTIPKSTPLEWLYLNQFKFYCVGSGFFQFGSLGLSFKDSLFFIDGTFDPGVDVYVGGGRCTVNDVEKTHFTLSGHDDCFGFFRGHIVHSVGERGVREFVEWLHEVSTVQNQ